MPDEIILPSQEFINRSKAKSVANKTFSKTPKNKGTEEPVEKRFKQYNFKYKEWLLNQY
jgi:hypothetical protein